MADLHVHVHHHFPSDAGPLEEIKSMLRHLTGKVNHMSAELDRLTASVASLTTVATSAETLLGTLADMIRALPADKAAIAKLADDVDANVAGLSAAVAANTPAAPTP